MSSGIRQGQLAEDVEATRTTISNIENGRQSISLEMFCRIAVALHEQPGNFLNRALGENYDLGLTHEDILDPKIREIINKTIEEATDEQE